MLHIFCANTAPRDSPMTGNTAPSFLRRSMGRALPSILTGVCAKPATECRLCLNGSQTARDNIVKYVQFGLCFSPNLGDGVIADCLGYAIRARQPDAEVVHIDMSARQGFGQVVIKNREAIIAIVDHLPLVVRQRLALWKLNRVMQGVTADWAQAAQADLAIIGGGQIFSDANLNFPIKVGHAFEILKQTGTPTAIYGVGVSKNWTPKGKSLFHKMQDVDLRMVGVRDEGSKKAWEAQVPFAPAPELTLDPGLFAADHYGPIEPDGTIGLCVTDFGILGHHANDTVAGAARGGVAFYTDIIAAALAQNKSVTLFSNGAAEDQALLAKIAAHPNVIAAKTSGQVIVPSTPTTPTELVAIIARCSAVIAHRLHACIVAYSYQRPVVGMGWDKKLEAFFDAAGQGDFFSSDPEISATEIVGKILAAKAQGIDPASHHALLAEAWDGIDRVLGCVNRPNAK